MSEFLESYNPFEGMPKDKRATIVVYGFDPIPGQLDPVVKHFAQDTDVFTYTYGNEVVSGGDPARLPKLVEQLTDRGNDIVSEYGQERVRTVGVSLGACIAMNMQDRLGLSTPGVYGAAGVTIVNNFMRNPVFRYYGIPKIYKENGHTLGSMHEAWNDIDLQKGQKLNENMRFWASASIFDPAAWYPLARLNFNPYIADGICKLQRSGAFLHTATINEMANHIAEATEAADSLAD